MAFREDAYYVEQVLAGEVNAFRHLVLKHQDLVYTIVHRIVPSAEEAEEVAQDVFIKVYRKLDGFKGKSSFSTWLYRIAYNAAISHSRKKKVEFLPAEENGMENIAEEQIENSIKGLGEDEQQNLLRQAMAMLPSTDSLIISLFYFHNKGVEEISGIIGMSASNVKVKMHRIRKRMLKEMNNLMNAGPEPAVKGGTIYE